MVLVVVLAATCSATAFLASRRILVVPVFLVRVMPVEVRELLLLVPLTAVVAEARVAQVREATIMRRPVTVVLVALV